MLKYLSLMMIIGGLTGCATLPPPKQAHDICQIFKQYPDWYTATRDVEKRWLLPIHVQMAIIYQESSFRADAKPPYQFLLGFIPMGRPSSAYGYAQALDSTWDLYKQNNGSLFSSRTHFKDGVDFMGWYANLAHRRANIQRNDAYRLYLAYHEGVTGYLNASDQNKPWLINIAHRVAAKASIYEAQLKKCR